MTKVKLPESLEGKTIVIAGAAGFVPSHVAELYLNLGAKVIGLDNFITGSQSNIELLSKYEKFDFHEANIYESIPDFKDLSWPSILSSNSFSINPGSTVLSTITIWPLESSEFRLLPTVNNAV